MSILTFVVSFCVIFYTCQSKEEEILDWESYKTVFGKIYANSVSESIHKENFLRNVKEIESHNAKYDDGNVTYALGLNEYSDQDPVTFDATMNGCIQSNETDIDEEIAIDPTVVPLADSCDWRTQNKVSSVKSQGSCGSCWAFATTGALESQMLIKGKGSASLSEQQLVDCETRSNGCNGGRADSAFRYIQKNGIVSQTDYPYKGRKGACKFSSSKVVTRVSSSQKVPNNAAQVMSKLQSIGPLSVAMDASRLQQYKRGIFECSSTRLSHAVLLVGYGTENGKDFWIIKNSWGSRWGEKGYVKVSRNSGRDCGITRDVSYATI